MELLENIKEMIEIFDSNIFDPKVVNTETELDGSPFVAREIRCGGSFVIAFSHKAGAAEIEKVSLPSNFTLELDTFWLTVTSLTLLFEKNL